MLPVTDLQILIYDGSSFGSNPTGGRNASDGLGFHSLGKVLWRLILPLRPGTSICALSCIITTSSIWYIIIVLRHPSRYDNLNCELVSQRYVTGRTVPPAGPGAAGESRCQWMELDTPVP